MTQAEIIQKRLESYATSPETDGLWSLWTQLERSLLAAKARSKRRRRHERRRSIKGKSHDQLRNERVIPVPPVSRMPSRPPIQVFLRDPIGPSPVLAVHIELPLSCLRDLMEYVPFSEMEHVYPSEMPLQ